MNINISLEQLNTYLHDLADDPSKKLIKTKDNRLAVVTPNTVKWSDKIVSILDLMKAVETHWRDPRAHIDPIQKKETLQFLGKIISHRKQTEGLWSLLKGKSSRTKQAEDWHLTLKPEIYEEAPPPQKTAGAVSKPKFTDSQRREKQYQVAELCVKRADKLQDDNPEKLSLLNEAIGLLQLAGASTKLSEIEYKLAALYEKMGDLDNAIKHYSNVYSRVYYDPVKSIAAQTALGRTNFLKNKHTYPYSLFNASTRGSAEATCLLGQYYEGLETDQEANKKKAFELYEDAVKKLEAQKDNNLYDSPDYTEAYVQLGRAYEKGIGTTPNPEKAVEAYQKAAEKGNKSPSLYQMYDTGAGLSKYNKGGRDYYNTVISASGYTYPDLLSDAANQKRRTDAKYFLASLYQNGWGGEKDVEKAKALLHELGQEHPKGQLALAGIYLEEKKYDSARTIFEKFSKEPYLAEDRHEAMYQLAKMAQDAKEAYRLFEESAKNGGQKAFLELGLACEQGIGVDKDLKKAFSWYEKAAQIGIPSSQGKVASMYLYSQGVDFRYVVKAKDWAEKGGNDPDSLAVLGLLALENGDTKLASDYAQKSMEAGKSVVALHLQSILKSQDKGIESEDDLKYLQEAADFGMAQAQFEMGKRFEKGVDEDLEKAFQWYLKAAEQGLPKAQGRVAFMYTFGKGTKEDVEAAKTWAEKAPKDSEALAVLSYLSYDKDKKKAKDYAEKSLQLDKDQPLANHMMGYLLYNERWPNKKKVLAYFEAAAAKFDFLLTDYSLAAMYQKGEGVDKNLQKATEFFIKALDTKENHKFSDYYYNIAKQQLVTIADSGNPDAQLYVGKMFEEQKEFDKAFKYYEKASFTNSRAGFHLARLYALGSGTHKDIKKAHGLFRVGLAEAQAKPDDLELQFTLANTYEEGLIVKRDRKKAMRSYLAILEKTGDPKLKKSCQERLANFYKKGRLMEEYTDHAVKWYQKQKDDGSAKQFLSVMYEKGYGGLEKDPNKAARLHEEAAELGSAESQYTFAMKLKLSNLEEAEKFLKKSAKGGYVEAQYELAKLLLAKPSAPPLSEDVGKISEEEAEAIKWLKKAVAQDHPEAIITLSQLISKKSVIKGDSLKVLQEAAELGLPEAQFEMGKRFEQGIDVNQDLKKAFHWYKKAAEQGVAKAQGHVAFMYLFERGVPYNGEQAKTWAEKAPKNSEALAVLSYISFNEDKKKAKEYAEKSLQLDKNQPLANHVMACCENNKQKAFEYLQKAAAKFDFPLTYSSMASLYKEGVGVKKDLEKATEMYIKMLENKENYSISSDSFKSAKENLVIIANTGNSDAQFYLGKLFENEKDLAKAIDYYKKAAPKNAQARLYLAKHYARGTGINKDLNEAYSLFKSAVADSKNKPDDLELKFGIASAREEGLIVEKNQKRAVKNYLAILKKTTDPHLKKSCEARLAKFYKKGLFIEEYTKHAVKWYKKQMDDSSAKQFLGVMYENGYGGLEKDANMAEQFYKEAAQLGTPETKYAYALKIKTGQPEEFLNFLTKASEDGHAIAQFDLAQLLLDQQNEEGAIQWLKKAAKQDHLDAQIKLSQIYSKKGMEKETIKWLEKGAHHPEAAPLQYELGNKYKEAQDIKQAKSWFKKAAAHKHTDAMYELAEIYQKEAKHNKAFEFFIEADKQGHPLAKRHIAIAYAQGLGVERNEDKGEKMLLRLVKSEDKEAEFALASFYESPGKLHDIKKAFAMYNKLADEGQPKALYRLAIAKEDENRTEAKYYYKQAALNGHPEAQYRMASLDDSEKAIDWYTLAAKNGHVESQFQLAMRLDAQKDPEALQWFEKAALQSHPKALYHLYFKYEEGIGVERDEARGVSLLTQAAERGDAHSQWRLGLKYERGEGVEIDYSKAMEWYEKAVGQRYARAQYRYGLVLIKGLGDIEAKPQRGRKYLQLAEAQGYEPAKRKLAQF